MSNSIDIANKLLPFSKATKTIALVTDSNVDALYGDEAVRQLEATGLRVERIVFPAGEKSKTLETYAELVRGLAALELTRTDFVIALGGGVVGDLVGFAAATYLRGIGVVQVPTTLLAMVDSSIGGKTGVDIPEGKNLVGAFHLPKQIIRDTNFLETLPEREMKNGLAEMIKTAVLFDREMFDKIEHLVSLAPREQLEQLGPNAADLRGASRSATGEQRDEPPVSVARGASDAPETRHCRLKLPVFQLAPLVSRCAAWKEKVVAEDFKEGGKRRLLNLGHTFGHAIESASGFQLGHGEAVALGMRIVGKDVPEIGEILDLFGYPKVECGPRSCFVTSDEDVASPLELNRESILKGIGVDKKRSGDSITLVVPREIGRCELVETPLSEVMDWLR